MSTEATATPWTTFLVSHLVWVVALAVALLVGHAWLAEHDARLAAETQIKTSEANVKNLTTQIATTNAAAVQKVQVITRVIHDVQTPAQAVAAFPQITDAPLNARVAPDNPAQVSVDAVPLAQALGECRIEKTDLDACQANLVAETAIVAEKTKEIATLKKPKSFFRRVGGTAKAVGIGIGVGLLLGAHL